MKTLSVRQASESLDDLIDAVTESNEPLVIRGSRGRALLVPAASWRAVMETVYLLSVPGMRESIRRGMATPADECSPEPGW